MNNVHLMKKNYYNEEENIMLIYAITSITCALLFYTAGVWGEKIGGGLKNWHVGIFWLGLVCDTLGTTLMGRIAGGGFELNFHGVTGLLAIVLMLLHAIWATFVLARGDEKKKADFHRFSIAVWSIWLVPFISGAVFGMAGKM
jgi:uncharacterized repeat protein (TIGR03987 family)